VPVSDPDRDEACATPAEVAAYLRVSPATLQHWRRTGAGPDYVKGPRHVRYRWSRVYRWVDEHTENGPTPTTGDRR